VPKEEIEAEECKFQEQQTLKKRRG